MTAYFDALGQGNVEGAFANMNGDVSFMWNGDPAYIPIAGYFDGTGLSGQYAARRFWNAKLKYMALDFTPGGGSHALVAYSDYRILADLTESFTVYGTGKSARLSKVLVVYSLTGNTVKSYVTEANIYVNSEHYAELNCNGTLECSDTITWTDSGVNTQVTPSIPVNATIQDIAMAYWDAFSSGDKAGAKQLLSTDIVVEFHSSTNFLQFGGVQNGPDGWDTWYRLTTENTEQQSYTLINMEACTNYVCAISYRERSFPKGSNHPLNVNAVFRLGFNNETLFINQIDIYTNSLEYVKAYCPGTLACNTVMNNTVIEYTPSEPCSSGQSVNYGLLYIMMMVVMFNLCFY